MSNKEVNKRTLESFIKSGALDTLPGTRKQKLIVSGDLLESKSKEKKTVMEGQMSFFDIAPEEEKDNFHITFPDVGEYDKQTLLAFEKETIGIYVSGHPMEEYRELWEKNVTAKTSDFVVDEDGRTVVEDNSNVVIGGMITSKKVKTTKTNQLMAFITIEDLVGTVEVLVFPKIYEKNRQAFTEENKVFIRGRASIGDDPVGKLICEEVIPFTDIPNELWLQFENQAFYASHIDDVKAALRNTDGKDQVIMYLKEERKRKSGEEVPIPVPAGWEEEKSLAFAENPVTIVKKTSVFPERIEEKKYTKCFDCDKIKDGLVLRMRRSVNYLRATAKGGKKKLKDYMIDAKIPKEERDSILLLADGPEIWWVVGYRRGESGRVGEDTKAVLQIQIGVGLTGRHPPVGLLRRWTCFHVRFICSRNRLTRW